MNLEEIKNKIDSEQKFSDYQGEDRIVSVNEVFEEESKNQTEEFFNTGIPTLDSLSSGFKKGQVIVITGIAKRGKTTFAKTITKNNEGKIKMLWFSFEESIYEFYKDINPCDFFVPKKMKPKDMKWLEERILESKVKYGTEVVFIDHLHYLFNMGLNGQNTTLLIGDLMRHLKTIAIDNKLVIFVLAHTKKVEGNRMPRAEDVRDSALIANECDKMYVVHRDRQEQGAGISTMSSETTIVVELDRQCGKNMGNTIKLGFDNNLLVDLKEYGYKPKPVERPIEKNRNLW